MFKNIVKLLKKNRILILFFILISIVILVLNNKNEAFVDNKEYDIVIIAGQSNAQGNGEGYFTPNYDGLNDKIKVIANAGIRKINYLKIYNRAGILVRSIDNLTEGQNGWDGLTLKGMADTDGYYWIAEYETKDNRTLKKSGSFLLIK